MTPFYGIAMDRSGQGYRLSGSVHANRRRTVVMTTDIAVVEFELGTFRASVEDGVVRGARFDTTPQPVHRDCAGVSERLVAYFDGDVDALDAIAAEPEGTAFQREVWKRLREIKAGSTLSY